jgi:hypothetical protein
MQGDVSQQGGAFVLGPGPVALLVHRDAHTFGHAPIDELLIAAGKTPFFHPPPPPPIAVLASQISHELSLER